MKDSASEPIVNDAHGDEDSDEDSDGIIADSPEPSDASNHVPSTVHNHVHSTGDSNEDGDGIVYGGPLEGEDDDREDAVRELEPYEVYSYRTGNPSDGVSARHAIYQAPDDGYHYNDSDGAPPKRHRRRIGFMPVWSLLAVFVIVVAGCIIAVMNANNHDELSDMGGAGDTTTCAGLPCNDGITDTTDRTPSNVSIDSGAVVTDTNENTMLMVTVHWRNDSDKTIDFAYAMYPAAYQHGRELTSMYATGLSDGTIYVSSDNAMDIKPGAETDIRLLYRLDDDSAVTVDIWSTDDMDRKYPVEKTFVLSDPHDDDNNTSE